MYENFTSLVIATGCTPSVSCGSPPSILNGSPGAPTSTLVGGSVNYTCDSGFILLDATASLVTCLSTGEWSTLPSCHSKQLITTIIFVRYWNVQKEEDLTTLSTNV